MCDRTSREPVYQGCHGREQSAALKFASRTARIRGSGAQETSKWLLGYDRSKQADEIHATKVDEAIS
ncbi:MAG: hypothetical protein KDB01_17500, partial [Planctomycetaceae bacterium]|nr:hypothetical protein [Planctomycetaceae bacterium]